MMGLQKKKKDKKWNLVQRLKLKKSWIDYLVNIYSVCQTRDLNYGLHWVELIFFIINLILKYKIP
jgi:hypothetical protein